MDIPIDTPVLCGWVVHCYKENWIFLYAKDALIFTGSIYTILDKKAVPKDTRFHYRKWLRYYLDYCHICIALRL